MTETSAPARKALVLLYSDDPAVREAMRLAIGAEPTADLSIRFVETTTHYEVMRVVDRDAVDLVVLDGEAAPAGGLGICRQIKDEIRDAPPVIVVIARSADRWLAAFSGAEATLEHPLDPMTTGETIATVLREHATR
jgi:DNA-binding response OmpR family regulator